ncbi:MAG: hypothetical protein K2V38_18930 [Gemmataceae bacterium]|nr:hypothetical protein [Gemmataceae bacterium]
MRAVFGLTVAGGVGLLAAAVWPGLLEDLVFSIPLFCVSVPLLGVWFLLLVGLALRDLAARPEPPARRRWWGVRSAAVMFGTMALLWFHVPQRVAFAFCAADLRGLVDAAPVGEYRGGVELGRKVGPYRVDRYAADERGGVYLRTATGPDGIGPDQMSYGFAFRPSGRGTPFGNARYRQRHLFGDWWVFAVSDDS